MGVRITWCLDDADDLDPVDPLGAVWLEDGAGSRMGDDCTNLDVFFRGILNTAIALRDSSQHTEDLIVEPDPIIGRLLVGSQVELSYGSGVVIAGDTEELMVVVAQESLNLVKRFSGFELSEELSELSRMANEILRA